MNINFLEIMVLLIIYLIINRGMYGLVDTV